jgi:Sulfite exporter TauE/SafE
VRPHVAHAVHADETPRVLTRAAADEGDECVPTGETLDLAASLLGDGRLVRSLHDRRERPVDVEQDCGSIRRLGEVVESRHASYDTAVRLIAIGLVAGFFSALFGVGGGIVVVPLLILLMGFTERPAMATSLASIGIIAAVGTISYAARGDVHFGYGLLLGLPAAAGAIVGTALQQRVSGPLLSYGFAVLLAAVGIWLLV